ncbi:MAG: protease inhibitor I42 family protein [Methanosarcina sp.]|jgi:inhibitor of cysteine peptidase
MQKVELLPPIKAKVGDVFEISIPSNPSTGYSCLMSEMPDCVFFVESTYVPDQPVRTGSGGTSQFKFVAVNKGKGRIIFHDVRFTHPLDIKEPNAMQKRCIIIE